MNRAFVLVVLVAVAAYYSYTTQKNSVPPIAEQAIAQRDAGSARATVGDDPIAKAFEGEQSNVQVQASGVVDKILADDNEGSRHQRFIVKLSSGRTVLIAHNIDLAARVSPLAIGDQVEFSGEYEWNNKGGVVHWTHRDPGGKHVAGWIKHAGQLFQ